MANTWTGQVWQAFRARELTPAFRDVLLRLQGFRGRRGFIFPSHSALADRARCCERTVGRALSAGAALGLVRWTERRIKVGRWATERTSNWYTLLVKNPQKPSTGQIGGGSSIEDIPSLFLLRSAHPMVAQACENLAAIAAARSERLAREWLAARAGGIGGDTIRHRSQGSGFVPGV